jgi:hypothetical protein
MNLWALILLQLLSRLCEIILDEIEEDVVVFL